MPGVVWIRSYISEAEGKFIANTTRLIPKPCARRFDFFVPGTRCNTKGFKNKKQNDFWIAATVAVTKFR
jgi:hypothetical protein